MTALLRTCTLWKLIYNPGGGLLATLLGLIGLPSETIAPLSSTLWALPAIAVADVWEWTPLVALLVFTALLAQDPQTLEAASLDGAHGFGKLRHITLPAVSGVVAAAFFIRLVLAFKVFDLDGNGTITKDEMAQAWLADSLQRHCVMLQFTGGLIILSGGEK